MKKFALCLMATFACLMSNPADAALPCYSESVREIDTVLDVQLDPTYSDLFKVSDVVVGVRRITKQLCVNDRRVKYLLEVASIDENGFRDRQKSYIVTLQVDPNAAIGPNEITVANVKKLKTRR